MIVCFGDAIVDLFALPRGSDVSAAESFKPCQGGAPANVAVVAARLGSLVRFVGAVGTDAHGDRLMRVLETAGVDTRSVVKLANRTGVTFVRVALDGARSFLFYRQGGADLSLSSEHLRALPVSPLHGASWLHLSSSALVMEPMASATRVMLQWAAEAGVPISLDLNVRPHLWDDRERMTREVRSLCTRAALIKASEEDLAAMDVASTMDGLRTLVGTDAVAVLTLAERGAIARIGTTDVTVPAPTVDVVDSTGAGDAFVGAMLSGLVARGMRVRNDSWSNPDAWHGLLGLACAVGARAVTSLGATEAVRELGDERRTLDATRAESGVTPRG